MIKRTERKQQKKDKTPTQNIVITGLMVNEKLDKIVKNRDLSKYFL